jgi:hypothetical protein
MLNFKNGERHDKAMQEAPRSPVNQGDSRQAPIAKHITHRLFLESIVARAVDPEAIQGILQQFAIENTITAPDLENWTRFARVKIRQVGGTLYILCPVPIFSDDARHLETGFAIDIDQDHFDVYPYMHDNASSEVLILNRLPHCVVRAIKMTASSYQEIGDSLKAVANETSAVLFISNLYTELGAGLDSPIEFFDNKLFQQLIGKVLSVKDGKWVNTRIVRARFDQLMYQLDHLALDSSFHEESKKRVMASLAHFLFETTKVLRIEDLLSIVDNDLFFSMLEPAISLLIHDQDLAIVMELVKNIGPVAPPAVVHSVFARLVAHGHVDPAMVLERVSGMNLGKNVDIVRHAFTIALQEGLIGQIHDIEAFFGMPFTARYDDILDACAVLIKQGRVTLAMDLERIAGIRCKPGDAIIKDACLRLLNLGDITNAILLQQWTGIDPVTDAPTIEAIAIKLLENGDVASTKQLVAWSNTIWQPDEKLAQALYTRLLSAGKVDYAMALEQWITIPYVPAADAVQAAYHAAFHGSKDFQASMKTATSILTWTKIPPTRDFIMDVYRLLPGLPGDDLSARGMVERARAVATWSGFKPGDGIVQDMFAALLHSSLDEAKKVNEMMALQSWTSTSPRTDLVLAAYKQALKPLLYKSLNVMLVKSLHGWTRVEVPRPLVQDAFTFLLSPPLKGSAIDEAAVLSSSTGIKPGESLVQVVFQHLMEQQVIDMKEDPVVAIRRVAEWSGFSVPASIARSGQAAAMARGDISLARTIGSWIGEPPAAKLVNDVFEILFHHPDPGGKWYCKVQEIIAWTGMSPGASLVHDAYATLLLGQPITPDHVKATLSLASITRTRPSASIIDKARAKLAREMQLGIERAEAVKLLDRLSQLLDNLQSYDGYHCSGSK